MGASQSGTARTSQEEQIQQIDGGSLTLEHGVYTTSQDWKKSVVRALQLARKLAPYYKGLEDYDPEWSNDQLISALRQNLESTPYNQALLSSVHDPAGSSNPPSETPSGRVTPARPSSFIDGNSANSNSANSTPARSQRPRAVTVDSSSNIHNITRPRVPFGALLYHNAVECPICFLYYPSNIATTRCCRQPICTECFVQIRRPNPHPPVVHADDPNPPPEHPETLIMESPVCPYCNQSDFGVIYNAPNFRLPRLPFEALPASEREVPATDTRVVLTDMIRPDWTGKLQRAKDRAARRAANAALITAHLHRQERRAAEARDRQSGRARRREYEALEEEQLAEAIRLSMLEDQQRRATPAPSAAPITSTRGPIAPAIEVETPTTPAVSVAGPSVPRASSDSYSRGMGSVPLPDLIYPPPPDSFDPRTFDKPTQQQYEEEVE
ncbi:Zf-C3HC4 type zinc finger [Taphrina deformans PYCC 5710]|uniref:Zf-C3HC4 type zinc finger n=1 Tax=Taphrina deformans (strain PYCC 5710 / ATCC 11124 / CBS 356.35 / IMI 108563 / JCM 9778 / NBRC 8474) TaxID=1097556 RepID=R4X6K5_TAPDE|nr:Zf-C3HC4 type zinc finger [Taphrina deformans PYCC 5710]|eukprot:CCG80765.1 Zf-C3HC4 type zinc finger [Taphrina deformans PYCC 5710]